MVLILGSLTAFGPLSMDMYLPSLPVVTDDFQTSTSLGQLSISACLLGLGAGQLLFGPLSDIIGRKRPLMVSLTFYAIASLLCAFSLNIWMFIGFRFLQGFSGAAGIVIARAAARDMYSGSRLTEFLAMLALVNGAAPILSPLFGGIILNFLSWNFVFILLCLIGVLMFMGVIFVLPETLPVQNRSEGGLAASLKTFTVLLKDPLFMSVALAQAFTSMSLFSYISGSPFVLQNMYDLTPQQFSFVFAINGVGIILAAQLTGRLVHKTDEINLLYIGVAMSFTGGFLLLFTIIFSLPLGILLLAFFLIVSSVGIVKTTSFSLCLNLQGKIAGSASAFLGILPFGGGSLVSPLVGIAGDQTALPMAVIIFISSMTAFILYLAMIRRNRSSYAEAKLHAN